MNSQIKTYTYPNGDIQRVQAVRWDDWSELDFLRLTRSDKALECFSNIYRNFLIPSAPWVFGNLVMFQLPEDLKFDFPTRTRKYGDVADPLTATAALLKDGITIIGGKPVFKNSRVKALWHALEERNCLRIISGNLPTTQIIPLGNFPGYLTEAEPDARLKVNASFFIMDPFDCATIYDHVGRPFGLCVRDGAVSSPPLYNREALLVRKDGSVSVDSLDIQDLKIQINGQVYSHGKNAVIYTRPKMTHTPPGSGTSLVIIGTQVSAVSRGKTPIPASGFVLCPARPCQVSPGDPVTYRGLEHIQFGIQVGNSLIRNGKKTETFLSKFYNIRHLEPVPYPPSLYPMDFSQARAARMAIGADRDGKPMLIWAEGAAKFGYEQGKGSCGASLTELADICADLGMVNGVNLDGGGSAQILLANCRSLMISDRSPSDFSETERPIPLALIMRP